MDGGQEHTAPPDLHNSLRLLLPKTEWKQSDAGRVHNAYIDRFVHWGAGPGRKWHGSRCGGEHGGPQAQSPNGAAQEGASRRGEGVREGEQLQTPTCATPQNR
eukprot:GGOE01007743.1.p3 GENE.GGOE01007743.1~~GGOE01007743.1.p3  ORF type:complete len:103 (+),score=8.13 GGOE01007743.1:169-477(+)